MTLSTSELDWHAPVEPVPPLLPPVQVGTLCAPYDRVGERVGAWVPITVCPARCHLIVHWPAHALAGPPFAALVLWDGGDRWCAMPMIGAAPEGHLDGDDVTVPLAPLDPEA